MPAEVVATAPVDALACWGSADLPGLGDQVLARVLAQQLAARLPGWAVTPLAPFGWHRPIRADGGLVVEPLGEPTPARIARLARRYRCSVLAPAFPLGADLAESYGGPVPAAPFFAGADTGKHPVLPLGVRVAGPVAPGLAALVAAEPLAAVRDAASRDLLGAGTVLAHPGVLADALVPADVLAARAAGLRQLGALPVGRAYLVLQLADALVPRLPRLHAAVDKVAAEAGVADVVVLPSGAPLPADAVERLDALGWSVVSPDVVLEDRLAVLAGAAAVIAGDEHGAAVATALDRPWVLYDPDHADHAVLAEFAPVPLAVDRPSLLVVGLRRWSRTADERAALLASARARLAEHLDAVAERALASVPAAGDRRLVDLAEENGALRAANDRLRRRMVLERHRLVERLLELDGEHAPADDGGAAAGRLRAELDHERELRRRAAELHEAAVAELAIQHRELTALRATKLYRWSLPARRLYGRLLRR